MPIEHIDTVKLPTYALCYLVNGDSSGLEDDDIDAIDRWYNSYGKELQLEAVDKESEPYFTHSPEFGLACDVVDYEIWGSPL